MGGAYAQLKLRPCRGQDSVVVLPVATFWLTVEYTPSSPGEVRLYRPSHCSPGSRSITYGEWVVRFFGQQSVRSAASQRPERSGGRGEG